jgi:hypothetical protein
MERGSIVEYNLEDIANLPLRRTLIILPTTI